MKLVVDASVALSWLFERTNLEESQCSNQVLLAMENYEALVPDLFHIEIANTLLVGERRKMVTEAKVIDYLNRLSELPIITDNVSPLRRRDFTLVLGREYNLTAYDATYLELALRTNAILATFDKELAEAMRRAGGAVFNEKPS